MQEQLLINNLHPVLKHHKAYGKELLRVWLILT